MGKSGVRGNLVPDASRAALAIEFGSEWITADHGFALSADDASVIRLSLRECSHQAPVHRREVASDKIR
ncbi:MAG: hypothetical protein JO281_00965 [Pseudonocardiales bacterium]|nr:hypothetical protein [Pseudonocardiales bacterium]